MNKVSKELIVLLYYVVLLFIISRVWSYLDRLQATSSANFDSTPFFYMSFLISFAIGLYIGIPHLVKQIKQEGTWKVNLSELLVVGVPILLLSIGSLSYFIYPNTELTLNIVNLIIRPFTTHYILELGMILSLILGFILVKCIYKTEN
jgi:hypothetical protein